MESGDTDVIVVGAGVNGLVCALLLAQAGLAVQIASDGPALGGTHRTEFPFAAAPRLPTFTGAHRIGFVPRVILDHLAMPMPLSPRDPALFVPTTKPGGQLLAGAGNEGLLAVAGSDHAALAAMFAELDDFVAQLAPAWTASPMPIEEVAERFLRPASRAPFVAVCRGSFDAYLARFGIESDILRAVLAADALGGTFASSSAAGTGGPLLVRHAAASLGGGGDALVAGGMGALARLLADRAQAAGATLITGVSVANLVVEGNTATGIVLSNGQVLHAGAVVTDADPWRLRALIGSDRLPAEYSQRIEAQARLGGAAKLSLALSELPRFTCLPTPQGQHRATAFFLPGDDARMGALASAFADASAGRLPEAPPIECVFPSAADDTLRDPDGRHSASLLVPWVPYDLAGTTWSAEEERFTAKLLEIVEAFAPGTRALVVDTALYHPKKIETHFGVTRGQLGHIDDTYLFGDRLPPTTPLGGLYSCGRAGGPCGNVFGVAGLNAFRRVIADFELALERTEVIKG